MEEQVVTTTEPTIVESTATDTNVVTNVEAPTVVEQATPMDANTTYSNLPKAEYQPNMTPTQNAINLAVKVENEVNKDNNAGKAMNKFLTQDYDYNKEEAGSYWVAGAINDNNTQMSFLQTIINEEMYDEMDLQKYYYDTNLATARAYAAQKEKEVAYGFYQAAQQKALAEGELTGWYMPAEGQYLLAQYTVAQNTLEDPDATPEQKAKASRVSKTSEEWFSANQITTRGMKCLAMMQYEESVRHNKAMEELSREANAINAAGNKISEAMANLNLREFKFKLEEYELQSGHNITKRLGLDNEETIGHNLKDYPGLDALEGFDNLGEALANSPSAYSAILGSSSAEWVNGVLEKYGYNAKDIYSQYENDVATTSFKSEIEKSGSISKENGAFKAMPKSKDGKELKYVLVDNEVVVGYFDDNVWIPIKDRDTQLANGITIDKYVSNMFGEGKLNTEGVNSVVIDGSTYFFGRGETSTDIGSFTSFSDSGYKKLEVNNALINTDWEKINKKARESETPEGTKDKNGKTIRNLKYEPGLMDTTYINEYLIFSAETDEGKKYYSFEADGELKEISDKGFKEVPEIDKNKNIEQDAFKSSWFVGYDKKNNVSYMVQPLKDGTLNYFKVSGNVQVYSPKEVEDILETNLSESEITKAGFKVPTTTVKDAEVSKKATNNNRYVKQEETDKTKDSNNKSWFDDLTKGVSTSKASISTSKSNSEKREALFEEYDIGVNDDAKKREALFKEYNVGVDERVKYVDILDPKRLKEKLEEKYDNILGMGGDQNGK